MLETIKSPDDLKRLSPEELKLLASDIRQFLIEHVTLTGGHLSPNLGIVELTIALHKVFNTPNDSIVWDVGHQAYVHKILTGRREDFSTLRLAQGLSGYPSPLESPYDCVHAGHSSTSISIAAGIARAKKMSGDTSETIAVIGDGAFTGGMVYEAINQISHEQLPVIIILNDNGMSISKNVGGMARYLKKLQLSPSYLRLKRLFASLAKKKSRGFGNTLIGILYKIKESLKTAFIKRNFFEDMGIAYYGPIDGHDIRWLLHTFSEIRGIGKPILIHALTMKGRGYAPSEANPGQYHGIAGTSAESGALHQPEGMSYSKVFGNKLCELAEKDSKVMAVTAAMASGTGLKEFAQKYPGRFTDVGIAEQHAVDFAFGLAIRGFKPFVAIYSTFLQRGFDQLIHDIGISGSPVTFCLDRSGLVPGDGETHQGIFDIAYLRMVPGFLVAAPATRRELEMMLDFAANETHGPLAIRYPKDEAVEFSDYDPAAVPLQVGRGVRVYPGEDVRLIAVGSMFAEAREARLLLEKKNIFTELYNLRWIKPINEETIEELLSGNMPLVILEEGIESGGVAQALEIEFRRKAPGRKILSLTLPDVFPGIGTRQELLEEFGLSGKKIAEQVMEFLSGAN